MPDPLWINAGGVTLVGNASIEADTEVLTLNAHGLANGTPVMVDTLTGGAVGVLFENTVYFVRDATANTFTLAGSEGGNLKPFGSDGTANIYQAVPQYDARDLRQAFSGLLMTGRFNESGDPVADHKFGAKSGLLSWRFLDGIGATVAGGNWAINDLVAAVYTGVSQLTGTYIVAVPSASGTYNPPDATNPRVDALDLEIRDDDEDASGFRDARVVYTAGTPAASPSAPAVVAGRLRLLTFQVATNGTTTILTRTPMTVARGGILPIRTVAELPVANRGTGQAVWYNDHQRLDVNTDGAGGWRTIASAHVPEHVQFTSSGSFVKASFPWARYVVVETQAGGGGGGGAGATGADAGAAGGGGGGGGYSRKIIDIADLAASETVTVGAAGAAGAAGGDGGTGGNSSFGAHCSATGGTGGDGTGAIGIYTNASGGDGGVGSGGDVNITGDDGGDGHVIEQDVNNNAAWGGMGGGSALAGSKRISGVDAADNGLAGYSFGGGGSGAFNGESATGKAGGAGAPGIVIVTVH